MKLSTRLSLTAIAVASTIFTAVMTLVYVGSERKMVDIAVQETQADLDHAAAMLNATLDDAEIIIRNLEAWVQRDISYNVADSVRGYVEYIVQCNPSIMGSSLAFKRDLFRDAGSYYMLYACRDERGGIKSMTLSDSTHYDYLHMPWYEEPMRTGQNAWSEPYFDLGAGNELMCTYTHLLRDRYKQPIGVLTIDISFDEIAKMVESFNTTSYSQPYLLSSDSIVLAHPDRQLLMHKAAKIGSSDDLSFTATIKTAGWTLGMQVSREVLLRPLHRAMWGLGGLFALAMAVLYFGITIAVERMARPEMQRQARIASELDVAHSIQQGMLPALFPPFPERSDIDLYATMQPAREIGGDFYNFTIHNEVLRFIIADVSGKGVPAAIVMAMATGQFNMQAREAHTPEEIVSRINRLISIDNTTNMFITMIVGMLDLHTGHLTLCNAGHNLPLLISADGATREVQLCSNLPVGLYEDFAYKSDSLHIHHGDTLLLFTDGVTEAENAHQAQYGVGRLRACCERYQQDAQPLIQNIVADVHSFAAGTLQSDDITLLSVSRPSKPSAT